MKGALHLSPSELSSKTTTRMATAMRKWATQSKREQNRSSKKHRRTQLVPSTQPAHQLATTIRNTSSLTADANKHAYRPNKCTPTKRTPLGHTPKPWHVQTLTNGRRLTQTISASLITSEP